MKLSDDPSRFVDVGRMIPDVITEIRYYTAYNFIGDRVDGYEEPLALLTAEAARALKKASDRAVEQGYRLRVYDAYRPQRAVDHFMRWAEDESDVRMKACFYPDLDKRDLIPGGYIARHSGHSRGSAVDLTLFDINLGRDADMGGPFDFFGPVSHPDCPDVTDKQRENRLRLRDLMTGCGFQPITTEWWHFVLSDEPFRDTYFTFPISSMALRGQ